MTPFAVELRSYQPRAISTAFAVAATIHLAAVAAFWGTRLAWPDRPALPGPLIRPFVVEELVERQSDATGYNVQQTSIQPHLGVTTRGDLGLPVPVPDEEVTPDAAPAAVVDVTGAPGAQAATTGRGDFPVAGTPAEAQDDVPRFVPCDRDPVAVKKVTPEYPSIARAAGLEGLVQVQVRVGEDGRVTRALVAASDSPLLDEAALRAARQWVFTPAVSGDHPVAVWVMIPFRFSVRD